MRHATALRVPKDLRFTRVDAPKILKPTDATIPLAATCICLSDITGPDWQFGFQSSCVQREFMSGAQAPKAAWHWPNQIADLLATCDFRAPAGGPPTRPASPASSRNAAAMVWPG